jgi:hypothetical protein
MVNSDVESDSALFAIAMGVLSEEEERRVKQGQTKSKKSSKGKGNLKSKKGGTGMKGNTRVGSPTVNEPQTNQNGVNLSPMPGFSRYSHDGDSSPTKHSMSNNRWNGVINDTEVGLGHTNRAVGQGDSTNYPYKTHKHDTRIGFSRDCGGAQSLSDRLNDERPSRARRSEDDDDGGRRRRSSATREDDRRHDAAVDAFPSSDGDSADEVRGAGRLQYLQNLAKRSLNRKG